jgi:hypothetical protein
MQYRAIGLIEGQYIPSPEHFTRGILRTSDGLDLNAVLLGRVMSLVRKHLRPERNYLWVVYPRTRDKTEDLHVQLLGVWAQKKWGELFPRDPVQQWCRIGFPSGARSFFNPRRKGSSSSRSVNRAKKLLPTPPLSESRRMELQPPSPKPSNCA